MAFTPEVKAWTIYKLTNPKGHIYIGCTSNFNRRQNAYRVISSSVKKQRLLYESLREFDFLSHTVEVLDEFSGTHLQAESKEMFWIRSSMSNRNKWPDLSGLNLTNGGKGNKGIKLSDEHKKLINRKGTKLTKEHIESIKRSNIGNKYTLGVKSTQEAIEARRIARNKQAKPVVQYNIEGVLVREFKSVNEAAAILNINKSNIYGLLCGQLRQLRGFTFKYKS